MSNLADSIMQWILDHGGFIIEAGDRKTIFNQMGIDLIKEVGETVPAVGQTLLVLDSMSTRASSTDDVRARLLTAASTFLEEVAQRTGVSLFFDQIVGLHDQVPSVDKSASLETSVLALEADSSASKLGLDVLAGISELRAAIGPLTDGMLSGVYSTDALKNINAAIVLDAEGVNTYLNANNLSEVADLITAVGPDLIAAAKGGEEGRAALATAIIGAVAYVCPLCGAIFSGLMALGPVIPDPGPGTAPRPSCEEWARSVGAAIMSRVNAGMAKPEHFDRCFNEAVLQRVFRGGASIPEECEDLYQCEK